jgi:hypothetical protein
MKLQIDRFGDMTLLRLLAGSRHAAALRRRRRIDMRHLRARADPRKTICDESAR